jgi:hypothetical protein
VVVLLLLFLQAGLPTVVASLLLFTVSNQTTQVERNLAGRAAGSGERAVVNAKRRGATTVTVATRGGGT